MKKRKNAQGRGKMIDAIIDFMFNWYFGFLLVLFILLYGNLFTKEKMGFKCNKFVDTSSLNPLDVIDGKKWTNTRVLSKYRQKSQKDFFIGNFRFSPSVLKNCKPPWWWRRQKEKTSIYLTRENLITSTMIFGGMKSGKSICLLNILYNITAYDNALVHDGTKLEFIAKTYNPIRDIIYNFYDDRATVHNILDEDTAIQAHFFQLMLSATAGKNSDSGFFTTGASEHIQNLALLANAQNFTCAKEKWNFFVVKLETLVENALNDGQKSEKDVISTLKQIMTPFLLMNYRIQDDADTFTIDEFLDKNHAAKLFVSYPRKLQANMQGLSAAFISMYTMVHLSRPDTDNKLYLYVLDELSSYLRVLGDDTDTLKDQTELLRSKSGAFIGGLQGKEEEEKYNKILDKTVTQKLFFRTDGRDTKTLLQESIGKVTYVCGKDSVSTQGLKAKTTSFATDQKDIFVVKEDDFLELGERFEYIASIGDDLYRGYIPIPPDEAERIAKARTIKKKKLPKEKEDLEIEKTYKNTPFIPYINLKAFDDYLATRYESYQIKRDKQNITQKLTKKFLDTDTDL